MQQTRKISRVAQRSDYPTRATCWILGAVLTSTVRADSQAIGSLFLPLTTSAVHR